MTIENVTVRCGTEDDLTIIELVWPQVGLTPRELRRALFKLRVHIVASELHTVGGQLRERLRVCDAGGRLLRGSRVEDVQRGLYAAVRQAQRDQVPAAELALETVA